jgi:hypothetical protein
MMVHGAVIHSGVEGGRMYGVRALAAAGGCPRRRGGGDRANKTCFRLRNNVVARSERHRLSSRAAGWQGDHGPRKLPVRIGLAADAGYSHATHTHSVQRLEACRR